MNDIPCENCKEFYDLQKRIPISLPCGHSLCKVCLADVFKRLSYIKCPVDSKKHFLKLDDFPTNFLVRKLISGEITTYASSSQIAKPINTEPVMKKSKSTPDNADTSSKVIYFFL